MNRYLRAKFENGDAEQTVVETRRDGMPPRYICQGVDCKVIEVGVIQMHEGANAARIVILDEPESVRPYSGSTRRI